MNIRVKMSLQLISIPDCDNKSLTISVWPSDAETINGVILNVRNEFQNWL